MCTSTAAVAEAVPAQPAMVIGDSTVEKSAIGTSVPLVARHPAGTGDGDGEGEGVGLGDGVGVGVGEGVGLGDGVGVGDGLGVGVAFGATVNDRVFVDEAVHARSLAYIEKVYEPAASPL